MINGENGGGGGGVAKPTPPPTLPKSYTPSAAAAYRLASMERLAQRQRIFEQGGTPPPSGGAAPDEQQRQHSPPPVTAPKPVLGTKASVMVFFFSRSLRWIVVNPFFSKQFNYCTFRIVLSVLRIICYRRYRNLFVAHVCCSNRKFRFLKNFQSVLYFIRVYITQEFLCTNESWLLSTRLKFRTFGITLSGILF